MSKCSIHSDNFQEKMVVYEQACKPRTRVTCFECYATIPRNTYCFELFHFGEEEGNNPDEINYGYICSDCHNAIEVFGLNFYGEFWGDLYDTIKECNADIELEKLDSLTPNNRQKICKLIDEYFEEYGYDED